MEEENAERGTTTRGLCFRILGPLEAAVSGKRLLLSGVVQERVLSMLLLEPGRVVPMPRLVEAAWEDPPATASHQVRKAVSDLRRRLPDDGVILTDGSGYRMVVAPGQLDLLEFDARIRAAEQDLRDDRRPEAAARLDAALGLWRGSVLSGQGGSVIEAAATALEERRLVATEELYDLRLALGLSGELVAGLRMLVSAHPLRETFRSQLMLALYRTGRKAEALNEYGQVREFLADELGVDPGPPLTKLYEGILRDEPGLVLPWQESAPVPDEPPAPPVRVCTLPQPLADFTGRARELAELLNCVDAADLQEGSDSRSARVVAVDGMGGSGKTSLAVWAAHRLADRFPDGQLHVDLRGFTPGEQPPVPPGTALHHLLRSLGVDDDQIPSDTEARANLWRATVAGRRLLLLLDNAAHVDQVTPLLAASPGCLVLITSRSRLLDLDGVSWVSVGLMTPQDSAALVAATLGADRVEAEPESAAELAELCGHLPLALRIATARLRNRSSWTLRYLAERLRDETRRLDELRSPQRSVSATLHLSYMALDEPQRAAFRTLGLHPSTGVDVHSAAALLGTGPHDAESTLEVLLDMRLVQQPQLGIYTLHDLVRSFARGLCGPATAQQDAAVVERLLGYYLTATDAACQILFPGREQRDTGIPAYDGSLPPCQDAEAARAWFDREHSGLLAAVSLAVLHRLPRHTVCLTRNLSFHLNARGQFDDLWNICRRALAAARDLDDPQLLCVTLSNVGVACWKVGRFADGLEAAQEARDVAVGLGDRRIQAHSESTIGLLASMLGRYEEALTLLSEAVTRSAKLGASRSEAEGLSTLSTLYEKWGRYTEAADTARRALEISRSIGYHGNLVMSLTDLAFAQVGLGELKEADENLAQARLLSELRTAPGDVGLVLALSAKVAYMRGRAADAEELALRALEVVRTGATPVRLAEVENIIGHLRYALGDHEAALVLHRHARKAAVEMGFCSEEASALAGIARAQEALGDREDAEGHRAEADRLYAFMGVRNPQTVFP
ncbi:BTAD domain-containing putative transcriptional regulator [Streptomyces sp. NBC_01089]|uniref:AfsR/SARP family transcriptional regulator n=1 Tax=Streptomyces sp. NBC_01089 TaxID=2903747 RepID=UPI003869E311|nr:tetratricopeptide repeat protein [Streptomyces sp. NBC_01089]WSU46370.1 tetratricopeptide repeat protein [Streptomyces sp. NBC_01089]